MSYIAVTMDDQALREAAALLGTKTKTKTKTDTVNLALRTVVARRRRLGVQPPLELDTQPAMSE
ncbi:type II toxin-antitoxin system VapB family antitoxin [Streptomyces albipurpureus]|uniref:Type II toxin-antitoxin system VapB family antitoxin n=1 Tax=Streptomyces albipurpureus TaxID=2897419 RepID=A0ABT0UV68_9ACTN|nr:type II toxin-antitoxin system VapB family antitoxin [Streptomyces sp. CWNU-1]MCM2392136.1 type II toxin-antitoxin system VapB family antitoxin [Streptomyces sp. CWNU-1]